MANEIHSLKIGNTEYPIYSEGLKIDDQVSGSAFLVVDGPNNRKVGTSTAIIGNSTSLSLKSDTISIGNGYEGYEPTVIIGDNAEMLYIGGGSTNPVTIHIGAGNDGEAPSTIKMGTPNGSIEIGEEATNVDIGKSANALHVGNSATTVGVGEAAEEVNIGHMSNSVNVGNQCTGDIVIGAGSVTTSEDEDGNEIVEKTTSTYIGENNYEVIIGNSASGVAVGPGANSVILGPNTNYTALGPNAKTINIGGNTTSDISITAGSDEADATIEFYDTDGLYDASQKINIKSSEVNACSQLVLNGAEVELSSNYRDGSSYKSCIYATDEELQITQLHSADTASIYMSGYDDGQECSVIDLKATRITIGDTGTDNATDNIKINAESYIDIDSGLHMGINAAGWIKNRAEAFFIGDTINGVPTDEYIEDCTHNVYINAFSNTASGTAAPISIKSGVSPRVITTTHYDGTSETDDITSFGGLSSLTNVEIGKEFNIKNDIISGIFFQSTVPNAATFSVGNKLKDSYTDTWTNVSSKTKADAEGVISMRVNDVYETNNNADVHSTIELTPTNYKLQNICIDNNDMCNTVYIDTNASLDINKHSVSIGCSSNNNSTESTYYQSNIKLYGEYDDLAGAVSIFAESYDGERTAMLDMKYNGITLSYDNQFDTTDTYINMGCDALKLYYNNAGYGVDEIISLGIDGTTITSSNLKVDAYGGNETIKLGTDGTAITSSNLKVYTSNLQMVVPLGNGNTDNPGIKLLHPNKNSNIGIVCYTPNASAATASTLIMAPCAAYSSSAKVNLGISTKRFGTLYVNGGYATTSFQSSSDERLKDFGDDIAVDLDALAALRKSYYRWNETSGFENEKDRMLGMSAQEVQKIYPEVVDADENGMLSMAYDRLSVVALAAIDKLHETNKELKAENDELKDRIANLENLVDTILSRIN